MAEAHKIPHLYDALTQGVAIHDRENPEHHTWGIGMSYFDVERLGLEEGEEILPGIILQVDGGTTGQFRILCDGDHDEQAEERQEELVEAVSSEEIDVPYTPLPVVPPV